MCADNYILKNMEISCLWMNVLSFVCGGICLYYAKTNKMNMFNIWVGFLCVSALYCIWKYTAFTPTAVADKKETESTPVPVSKDTMYYIYAPWCGFCKKATPVWKEFVSQKKSEFPGVDFVMVNSDDKKNEALMATYKVRGFPTFLFQHADASKGHSVFKGSRTVDDLTAFLSSRK